MLIRERMFAIESVEGVTVNDTPLIEKVPAVTAVIRLALFCVSRTFGFKPLIGPADTIVPIVVVFWTLAMSSLRTVAKLPESDGEPTEMG